MRQMGLHLKSDSWFSHGTRLDESRSIVFSTELSRARVPSMKLHPVLARARSSAFARMEMPVIPLTEKPRTKTRAIGKGSGTVGFTPSGSPSTNSGLASGGSTIFNLPGNPPTGSQAEDLHGAKIGNVSLQLLFWGSAWQQP